MLVEFRVKNFLSFKDEVVFSMLTSGKKEHPENLIPFDEAKDEYLTKAALIYGANASGKTNLLKAMHFLCVNVLKSKDLSTSENIDLTSFLFDEKTPKQPASFEIKFIRGSVLYIYGLELDSEKIHKEYLYETPKKKFNARPIKIFEREDNQEFNLNNNVSKLKKKYLTESAQNRLYLSVSGFWQDKDVLEAYKWFEENVITFLSGFTNLKEPIFGYTKRRLINESNKPEKKYWDKIIEFFSKIDSGITGLALSKADLTEMEKEIPKDFSENERKEILNYIKNKSLVLESVHKIENKEYLLPFDEFASLGTKKSLDLIGILVDLIEKQGVLIMDELENSLHPELIKVLLKQIQKSNCNVQIIFTTHDTTLMQLDMFRKDQFWFVNKHPKKQYSELFSLADIQGVRSNEKNLQKKYLLGRYGAFPYIRDLEKVLCK